MSLIIPFEDKLISNKGAFIEPNGKIIFTPYDHERYADDICNGIYHQFLSQETSQDIYQSSQLTSEQLELYKLWCQNYQYIKEKTFSYLAVRTSDFLVYILGYDKVQTLYKRAIITTCPQPHIRFYNYYLMDWCIDQQNLMKFNKDTGLFEEDIDDNWLIKYQEDREVENEINEIKNKVLLKDRYLFFK